MNMNSSDGALTTCDYVLMAWTSTFIFLSPVFLFVIFVGLRQCWKSRSHSSGPTHSDIFTFNMAAIELFGVLSSFVTFSLNYISYKNLQNVVDSLSVLTADGQTLLHILVCLERYLAVVHPITYLRLKKRGVAIRNVSVALVWLFSFAVSSMRFSKLETRYVIIITGVISLVFITFFCANVLYVLVRPGPGERGGDRKRVDQLKRRAFYTVAAITAVLMLKFVSLFVMFMAKVSGEVGRDDFCLVSMSILWLHIPSSLVMPVLFLYRRVKQRKKTNP